MFSVGDMVLVPAPVGGWDTAISRARMPEDRGIMLRNFFPQPDYVEIRRGCRMHHNTGTGAPVETLMPWHGSTGEKLFAASGGSVFDIDGIIPTLAGMSNNRFQSVNFSTPGGQFLWVCNGANAPRYFDGSDWSTASITGTDADKAIAVSIHKGRVWFTLKGTTKAAYLPALSIQGAATEFNVGQLFSKGGELVATGSWSVDGGDGPDDLMVFISSRGQAAIYKGTDPANLDTWEVVGVYDIGEPIGRRCFRQFGADLAVITTAGVVPLSKAMLTDRGQSQSVALTGQIQREMNTAARSWGGNFGWEAVSYPRGTMAILNVPMKENASQKQFVMNSLTGAWCEFTGWDANTFAVFGSRLFYGGNDGKVFEADLPGADEGRYFDAVIRTAWSAYGGRSRMKRWTLVQPNIESNLYVTPTVRALTDFDVSPPRGITSSIQLSPDDALWDQAIWDQSKWARENLIQRDWYALSGIGRQASIEYGVRIMAPSADTGDAADDRFAFHLRAIGFEVLFETGGAL